MSKLLARSRVQKVIEQYRTYFRDKSFLVSTGSAILLFALSLWINFHAGIYATSRSSNYVTDVILSNIPVFHPEFLFVYGSVLLWVFVGILCLAKPRIIPFTLKSIALFVLVRAVFISITHIGPFPTHMEINPASIVGDFTFGGDLFFSGHTGLPFLMALIFWENRFLRYTFIIASVVFAVVVLLAHLHYSIDVLGAFFITYTIFHIAEVIFKKDQRFLNAKNIESIFPK